MINKHLGAQCESGLHAINHQQESRLSLKPVSRSCTCYLSLQTLSIFGTLRQTLPSRHHSLGRCREARQAALWRGAAVWEDAGSPHRQPRLHHAAGETPCGTGPGQLEVGRLTFPARQTNRAGGYSRCRGAKSTSTG